MAQRNESGIRTFIAGEALEQYRRVKLSAEDTVVYADADEPCVGFTERKVAVGEDVAVRFQMYGGSHLAVAGGAITVNADLEADADGKVVTQSAGTTRYSNLVWGSLVSP